MLALLLKQAFEFYACGEYKAAESICIEVLKAYPKCFDAAHLRGVLSGELGNFAKSASLLQQAVSLAPSNAAVHLHLGDSLRRLRRNEDALVSYERALHLQPNFVEAWNNQGNALRELGRLSEAIESLRRARALSPNDAHIENNLGNAFRDAGMNTDALACYDRAIALSPNYAEAYNNRGFVLVALRRTAEALESYAKAQAIRPDYARAHLNEGLCRLLLEDYVIGWEKYEWRWADVQRSSSPAYEQPRLMGGEPLQGKTVFVPPEQGFGDYIQFSRYLPELSARGAKVIAGVPAELGGLLAPLPGITFTSEEIVDCDFYCPIASLPFAISRAAPVSQASYLRAPQERIAFWQRKLRMSGRKRVALAWSGSNTDPLRRIPLQQLLELSCEGWDFYSVQKDVPKPDLATLAATTEVLHLGGELSDFSDTAAILSLMDLVISIDTSVAHLAGALGKPVCVLLHTASDWRYGIEGETCAWYPSMRLFRQSSPGDWQRPLRNLKEELLTH